MFSHGRLPFDETLKRIGKKKVGLQFSFHEVLAGGEETPLVVICITRAFRGDKKNIVKGCVINREETLPTSRHRCRARDSC